MRYGPTLRQATAILGLVFPLLAFARPAAAEPSGVWIGQDGHDLVGHSPALAGNDCQDIHIKLSGLPPRREIAYGSLKGFGGGEWQYKGGPGSWLAQIERKPGASKADLYFDPDKAEDGRGFELHLRFDDGTTANFWIKGGVADPDLRMPKAALKVRWLGQDGQDRAGPGPSVGPDGLQDLHLVVENLSSKAETKTLRIDAPGGARWQFGPNPEGLDNVEMIRRPDDPTKADLFLHAGRDPKGQNWTIEVAYSDGKADRAKLLAGKADPDLRMPAVAAPKFLAHGITARWVGQEPQAPGDVKVTLAKLPAGKLIVAAALGDSVQGTWAWKEGDKVDFWSEPFGRPLTIRRIDATRAELRFPPSRDEKGATMTLRLVFADGKSAVVRFPGGPCDPCRRSPAPASAKTTAKPGDDLNDLANRFGTVRLAKGEHLLARPLVLDHPVRIIGEPGATVIFAQGKADPPWSAALKIHAGQTTLEGFAVRFAGPVRWAQGVDHGPAVVGTTDNQDQGPHDDPRADISILKMDLESPPASTDWEEAPRLLRLVTAACGTIEGNTFKGGITELAGGPWRVIENEHRGAMPNTFGFAAFAVHRTHDLILRKNRARAVGPSGKTWRFLVMTDGGSGDLIEGNTVEGVGPRDDDKGPNANAPEIVLTEAYRLHFEGKPAAISADGRVLKIPAPQGDHARCGDAVAILTGPDAGTWVRVAQAIDPTTYLLDKPLSRGDEVVSIATGFVDETYRDNTIDARGGAVAAPLVLVGNHFGTKVLDNRLLGGGEAFRITAAPTEGPSPWGWSHAPFLGGRIEGNSVEDAGRGATLTVEHSPSIRPNRGRVYLTATVKDNAFRWTAPFLARRDPNAGPLAGLNVGDHGALDPGELVVEEQGTRAEGPPGSSEIEPLRHNACVVNGKAIFGGKPHRPKRPEGRAGAGSSKSR